MAAVIEAFIVWPYKIDNYWSIVLQMEHCFLAITLDLKWEF